MGDTLVIHSEILVVISVEFCWNTHSIYALTYILVCNHLTNAEQWITEKLNKSYLHFVIAT